MVKAVVRRYGSALLLLAASAAPAQQYIISTLAGGAPPANAASAAGISIGQPRRVAVDSSGNVYFSSLNSVFKLSTNGSLALVAGNSRAGFSGDGGPAVNAQLNSPQGLAVDSSGNLYIADAGNNRVRMVTAAGIISTFAGNGLPGAYQSVGDWSPAPQGNLHLPSGVAVDQSGNVYIADTSNHSIRKVQASGPNAGLIRTIAGDTFPGYMGDGLLATKAEFQSPEDVALDSSGNIYIADTGNAYIRKITTDGIINSIAGNGIHRLFRRRRPGHRSGPVRALQHFRGFRRRRVHRRGRRLPRAHDRYQTRHQHHRRQRFARVRRRDRSGRRRATELAHRRRRGFGREPLRGRFAERARPQDHQERRHLHRGRQRRLQLFGRRRAGG